MNTNWIHVSFRYPKINKDVFVWEKWCSSPFVGYWDGTKWKVSKEFVHVRGDAYIEDDISQLYIEFWCEIGDSPYILTN